MRKEIENLKVNMQALETELEKARSVIKNQGDAIRIWKLTGVIKRN